MAGRPKKRIDYAGWSVDIFSSDTKIDKLLDAQGWVGFGVYFYLCQMAFASEGYFYEWCYDLCATTARKMGGGVSAGTVKETVDYCLRIGLFNKRLFDRWGVLTSKGIQKSYLIVLKSKNRKGTEVYKEFWLLDKNDEDYQGVIFVRKNKDLLVENEHLLEANSHSLGENDHSLEQKESKVKDSKENTIVEQNSTETKIPYLEIITYLNEKAEKHFKHDSKATQRVINGRFLDGFSLEDFKKVIDLKCSQWKDDFKMSAYLRPETLFAPSHFESYLNEAPKREEKVKSAKSEIEEELVGDDWMEINQNGG